MTFEVYLKTDHSSLISAFIHTNIYDPEWMNKLLKTKEEKKVILSKSANKLDLICNS